MKPARKNKGLKNEKRGGRTRVIAAIPGEIAPGLTRWLAPVLIALLAGTAFLPALQNGFVNWDDEATLVQNPNYRGLGWTELRWMFSTFYMGHYQPLSWMTFSLDYLLWGMDPFGYHLTNLVLHGANAVLFYFLSLGLLSLALPSAVTTSNLALAAAATFAALVFGVHPLRVESVAWATQRRDVLSGFFLLWTVFFYLKATTGLKGGPVRGRWLIAALSVYSLSLLSKAAGIILPIALLVLDVYPLRRLGYGPGKSFGREARRLLWEKSPFFLLAIVFGVVALFAQQEAGALKSLERYGVTARIAQALFGVAFYLWKTFFPLELSPLYELPTHLDLWDWPFVLSGLVVVAVSAGLYLARHQWPAGLASWVCYVVILAPVLGTAQSGPQIVADRYSYLSCLGWSILAGAAFFLSLQVCSSGRRLLVLLPGLACAVLAVLWVLTWKQTQVWRDSERLWTHALAVSPQSSTVHYNLALILRQRGKLEEAIEHYRRSLQINARAPDALNNLGELLAQRGELEEAIQHYRQALQINPAYTKAHNNLGAVLAQRGELEEAIQHYRQALQINPADADLYYNLGEVLAQRGELEEAIKYYRQALQINPADADARIRLAEALLQRGALTEAIEHFREAVRIRPDVAEAHESLGRALAQHGRRDEAMKHYQEALRILKSRREAQVPR